MKRIILSIISGALCLFAANAQNFSTDNTNNKPYFGIRVAGEITCPGDLSDGNVSVNAYKNGGGIEFGGIYNIPLVSNFYIEPGLKFFYNTYAINDDLKDAIEDEIGSFDGMSLRKFGVRIPVMAGYRFILANDLNVYVFTGPEFEIGISAKARLSNEGVSVSESVYGEDGGMNRFDALWTVGAGVGIKKMTIAISGSIGMCNMYNVSGIKFHENRVALTVGYNF